MVCRVRIAHFGLCFLQLSGADEGGEFPVQIISPLVELEMIIQ